MDNKAVINTNNIAQKKNVNSNTILFKTRIRIGRCKIAYIDRIFDDNVRYEEMVNFEGKYDPNVKNMV